MANSVFEGRRWLPVGGAILAVLVGLLAVTLFGYPPPCEDDLAFDGPRVDFSIAYQNATDEVVVRHQKGDTLRTEWTEALFVVVDAGDSDNRTQYTLANSSDGFPVATGHQSTLESVTVSGRSLTDGDVIRIVWRGSEQPLPWYCPNSRSDTVTANTVAEHTVQ